MYSKEKFEIIRALGDIGVDAENVKWSTKKWVSVISEKCKLNFEERPDLKVALKEVTLGFVHFVDISTIENSSTLIYLKTSVFFFCFFFYY